MDQVQFLNSHAFRSVICVIPRFAARPIRHNIQHCVSAASVFTVGEEPVDALAARQCIDIVVVEYSLIHAVITY